MTAHPRAIRGYDRCRQAMLALTALAATPCTAQTPPAGRTTIGVYNGWGAFRDGRPARCFAIARPIVAGGRSAGYADVARRPGRVDRAFHVRLSRPRDRQAAVTLTIGERRFALAGSDIHAWALDPAGDRAITAALRSGRSMSVEAIATDGRPFADVYALAGAATAIDAATLACAGR